jgi:rod shape-determining protein MreD
MTRALPVGVQTALVAALGVVAVQASLLPLGTTAVPDLLYCVVIAWTVRRPESAPLWTILALGLYADIMLSRPIGLGTLGLLLASEAMRANAGRFHGAPFLLEWLAAVAAFALILAGIAALLRLAFADTPGLPVLLAHLTSTALAYPLVCVALVWGLGLRGPSRGRTGERRLGRIE